MNPIRKKILIATGNLGKKAEILDFFSDLKNIDFLSLSDFPQIVDAEENGKSFEENASIKALYFGEKFGIPTIGEDSGLILPAFPEKFGIRTKREFTAQDDADWVNQFLNLLKNREDRRATFFSAMAFYEPKFGIRTVVLGKTSGFITKSPQTELEKGIPVSSVFIPENEEIVFSAMLKSQKNAVSHRGKASKMLSKWIETNFL